MKVGDWVAERGDERGFYNQPIFGRVKEVYDDGFSAGLFDLVCYNHAGDKVGRISDAYRGPSTFEPCLTQSNYVEIRPPKFPLDRHTWGWQLEAK
ncbi:MAG: hypothetical protein ABL984_00565 [Pyrinomonadaceae bacterium]